MPFDIDANDFTKFGVGLKLATRELSHELRSELKAAGEIVATEARAIAGAHSKKIAATIKVRTRANGRVIIEAGGPGVPEAYLLERGNRGSNPAATTFRHPVFGGDTWVEQPKHPYIEPALIANRDEVVSRVKGAVERTWSHSKE